ncbi:RHS repeat domain-containing protein [Alteromonas macleodii]|uniref:RHS repeat domain-containing protein n=1 Tax=Alteromonas macleodii TaxID=28108 RepID=UPI0009B8F8AF|nr:RHS repeat-associated core domain-containing protein [Alteromonas macleodii]
MSSRFLYFSMVVILHFSISSYSKAEAIDTKAVIDTENATLSFNNALVSKSSEASDSTLLASKKAPNASIMALPPSGGGPGDDTPQKYAFSSKELFDTSLDSPAQTATSIMGDVYDPYTGEVSFKNTDILINTNSGMPIEIKRVRSRVIDYKILGDWALDLPRLYGPSAGNYFIGPDTCSWLWNASKYIGGGEASDAPNGPFLGGVDSNSLLLRSIGNISEPDSSLFISESNWHVSCANDKYVATAPNGTKYEFGQLTYAPKMGSVPRGMSTAHLLVTKITDRFDNSISYTYESGFIKKIQSSDGVIVTFEYSGTEVSSITANGRKWSYEYSNSELKRVIRPDGTFWEYDFSDFDKFPSRTDSVTEVGVANMKHPNGATALFKVKETLHGRTKVPLAVHAPTGKRLFYPNTHYMSLTEKVIKPSSNGMEYSWSYSYSENEGAFEDNNSSSILPTKTTTILKPDGSRQVETLFRTFDWKEGKTQKIENFGSNSTLLSKTLIYWKGGEKIGSFLGNTLSNTEKDDHRVLLEKSVITNYLDYGNDIYTTIYSGFDKYGYPLLTTESNNYNSSKRYTKNYFYHDTRNWLIGLPSRTLVSSNGSSYKETQKTTYHSASGVYKSLPNYHYAYGRWYKRNESYHTSGSQKGLPKVVRHNGTNRWVEFSNYKRGIAQTIRTPQSLSTSSQYAYRVVDNNGWITKKTNFLGECITYSHDSMGRTDLVSPCNSSWYDTSISYSTTTSNEGFSYLSAGYLKQTVTKGNYEKITYFDGLLRPIVSRERDKSISSSKRYTRQGYDAFNRLTYQSKPHSLHSTPYGVVNQYDGLGRLIKADDNTTSGSISYSYLSNNRVQVNDNEGNTTTTSFLAYGSPEQSVATQISAPHGVITTLNYNIYGNLTSINQGGLTEYRVYDTYQQLCKTVRNDIGRSAYVYDAIGQLSWTASGDSVSTSTTSCDSNVYNSEKTTLSYDNLGNVRKVEYGDGTSSKLFTYDKNSNLKELVHGDVTQNYDYNDLNLLTSERLRLDSVDWTVSYAYDDYGNKLNVRYPGGGRLWYNPNALGQPKNVGSFASNISFHANGQYKSIKLKNGCINSLSLYNSGLPKVQRSACGSNNIVYNQYTYDANGNITYWDDKQSNTYDLRFTYDGLDRLDNIRNGSNSLIGDLNYDTMGNITKLDSIAGTINYAYNSSKQLQSTSGMRGYDFSYDDRGNVTNNGFNSFTYNLANEMVNANGNSYVYDGHGKRVKASDSEGTRYSFYSMFGQIIYEKINGSNRENYYLGSQLVAHQGAGAVTFIHPDILGTSAGKTDNSGNLVRRLRYAPFGLEWGKTNASSGENEIGYTGHKHDKSIGLTYMQARYYDPVIGRFYSNDPVGTLEHLGGTGGIHGFNRYAYANNNPYKYTDPNGENPALAVKGGWRIGQSIGNGINSATRALTGKTLSAHLANAAFAVLHNESADPVDGITDGKSPAKGEAGEKGQLEGVGGAEGALGDLGSLPIAEGTEWSSPDGSRQGGELGDGSGRKVNVHPSGGGDSYPQGTPTLEVQKPNGKTEIKIRYPEEKSS